MLLVLHFHSKEQSAFFLQLHGCALVAWINRFLVVWFDNISHILCATVAYIHIIPIENFMKPCSNAKNADLSVEGASLQRL